MGIALSRKKKQSPVIEETKIQEFSFDHEEKSPVTDAAKIPGYYLKRCMYCGLYSDVWLGYNVVKGEKVAIKIVNKLNTPEDILTRFLPREISLLQRLDHPNIIRCLNVCETRKNVYITTEFVERGTLTDMIAKLNHIDEQPAKQWFRQLINAIEYCHGQNIVHRDIKCNNILLDDKMNIKLCDFGYSRLHEQSTLCETFCGTQGYLSPEVVGQIPYDPFYADIWSMGVVFYVMLTGHMPFNSTNYNGLMKEVRKKVTFRDTPIISESSKNLIHKTLVIMPHRPNIWQLKSLSSH